MFMIAIKYTRYAQKVYNQGLLKQTNKPAVMQS